MFDRRRHVDDIQLTDRGGLDLRQLDPVAVDLDLGIPTPEELYLAILAHTSEVARSIDATQLRC